MTALAAGGPAIGTLVVATRVVGVPVTQGSKTAFVVKGRAVMAESRRATLKPWREAIRCTLVDLLGHAWEPLAGPVGVHLTFALPKPSSAPKRRRTWPIGQRSGDIDKLERAVLDALTDAGVWRDDAQVVELYATKDYPGPEAGGMTPGVAIAVYDLAAV